MPARKLEVNKPKKKNIKHRSNKQDDELNDVFTLQPIFKPPKSTLDLDKSEDKTNKNSFYSVKKNYERSKTEPGFNHFTMSRPGTLKSPETSVGHKEINNHYKNSACGLPSKVQVINFSRGPTATQITAGPDNAASTDARRKPQYRRASSGEELLLAAASRRHSRKNSTREISNPTNVSGAGGSKSLASSPRPHRVQDPQRRKSAGCKLICSQDSKETETQVTSRRSRAEPLQC